ncbi:MAG: serine/threonine protein kinase, partial [Myxococcaceae bacterium]|nr:serine/threonine protein kinase [Myxococcaceae bacterium]
MPAVAFGRYQLLERLAVGGMAELFLARAQGDGGFSKTCVVKRVLPHLAADAGFVSMFLDEARLAARLDHPGIAQIFDLGKVGTDYYLAMEYLAGEDAAAILAKLEDRQRQLPVPLAVQIVALAADALHFAHEHRGDDGRPLQVVHRDVSPGNLFVTYRGQVKVLDFGIAHGAGRLGRTEPGQVKGKTAYMSPEQSLAQPVDRRTDVWALGVCLYELLTARRLFTGRTAVETALQVVQDPIPSLRAARPEVPEALEQVVMQALERDVQQRWPTAQAFAEALRPFLPGPADRTLSDELRSLFGESRAQLQLGKASALPQSRGPGTEALGKAPRVVDATEALRSRDPAPATDPSGVAPGRTSRRGLVLGAGLATGA